MARDRGERRQALLDLVREMALRARRDPPIVLRDVHLGGEPLLAAAAEEFVDRHRVSSCGARGASSANRVASTRPSLVVAPSDLQRPAHHDKFVGRNRNDHGPTGHLTLEENRATGRLATPVGRPGASHLKSVAVQCLIESLIIAGLEKAEKGRILWQANDLSGVPVHHRNFGLMFQEYALFPHRSVAENVAFGLRMQNIARSEIDARVKEALGLVNLVDFAGRRVTDLSGGEQQRVAVARAVVNHPKVILADEPTGNLDSHTGAEIMDEEHAIRFCHFGQRATHAFLLHHIRGFTQTCRINHM